MKNAIRWILILVSLVILCYTGYRLFHSISAYRQADQFYADTAETYVSPALAPQQVGAKPDPVDAPESNTETAPITVDFPSLLAVNSDAVGWLYCADTVINYPIAQGETNDTYLHHMLDGTYSNSGTLFLDCSAAEDFSDDISAVYGHNMKNGSMFHSLLEYKNQDYYDAHPILYLLTPSQNYKVQLFSGFVTDATGWVYDFTCSDTAEKASYLTQVCTASCFTSDVIPTAEDQILLLSTCSYDYNNARFVVLGVLTPIS